MLKFACMSHYVGLSIISVIEVSPENCSYVPAHGTCLVLQDLADMTRVTLINQSVESKISSSTDTVVETTQDFTDSAYTTHENRERILALFDKVRMCAKQLVNSTSSNTNAVSCNDPSSMRHSCT